MKNKTKVVLLSAVLASALVAAEAPKAEITAPVFSEAPYKYVKKSITADDGTLTGYLRIHHIYDDDVDSAIGKVTGSTLGLGLGYGREIMPGLKVGGEFYGVVDTGLTDKNVKTPNIAYGQFMNTHSGGQNLDPGYAWGVHLRYENDDYKVQLARSEYDSPLTNIVQITHVPNMYEYARVDTEILGGKASLGFINKMAYGSRSVADWSLIGENTGTAGMYISPISGNLAVDPLIIKGNFYSIEDTLDAGKSNSSGIVQLGYQKKKGMWELNVWDQYIDDIANNIYIQGSKKFPLGNGNVFKLSAHVWNQDILNSYYDSLNKYGGTLVGGEALLKWGQFVGKFAYESKDEGGLLNAWGANPGYTSTIFSRNEYRSNVNAYKTTLVYTPMEGLKFVVAYANYGKSDMKLGTVVAQKDATERDIVIEYMPRTDLTFRLFNAKRVSEFDRAAQKRTMDHTRLIVNFAF